MYSKNIIFFSFPFRTTNVTRNIYRNVLGNLLHAFASVCGNKLLQSDGQVFVNVLEIL